ncbi:hypothetical protein Vadar_020185 [Vaccinium darrowii]|uniref:Uncharacterized protein n=1 Tax=Vaccinium darrowii TaxID=229202 RepID=A0ACB7X298_9ERIC|nr:hypothetical protein Vadar_020185 [Vaccinium darrowii]
MCMNDMHLGLKPRTFEEIGRVNDPKYCHYHRIVSHPIEKCSMLKELLVDRASKNKILLDLNEAAESNPTTIVVDHMIPQILVEKQRKSIKKSRRNKPRAKSVRPRRGHEKKNHHQYAKKKRGRKMKAKKDVLEVHKPVEQNPCPPVTLRDFFPTGYFKDDKVEAIYMISTSEGIAEDKEQNHDEGNYEQRS